MSYFCRLALSFLAVPFILATQPIFAETEDDEAPIRLVGNSVQANLADADSSWSFIGSVKLDRGSMTMTADSMTVERTAGKIVTVVAEGTPVQFTQSKPNLVTASSSRVTYSVEDQTIVLSGEVMLLQEGNQIRGEHVEYDLAVGELVAGSTNPSDGQQIEFVLDDVD